MGVHYHKRNIIQGNAAFQLDSNNKLSYIGSGTACVDLVGRVAGTLTNGVGFVENSFDFDGINDYIEFGDIPTSTEITVEAWCKPDSFTSFNQIAGKWENTTPSSTHNSWVLDFQNDEARFIVSDGSSANIAKFGSTSASGVWHHVVGTYDGATVKVYVDKVLGSTTAASASLNSITKNGLVGSFWATGLSPSRFFNGLIPYVNQYDVALTQAEIEHNYNSQKGRYE